MSAAELHFRRALPADYPGIETLLNAFYVGNMSADDAHAYGFLSAPFTQTQIAGFNEGLGTLVAVEGEAVLGVLGLGESDAPAIGPVTQAMAAAMQHATFDGQPLTAHKTFIFGPIAIARQARGHGIFHGLYRTMWNFLDPLRYELGLAFIAQNNPRSLTAHRKALGVVTLSAFDVGDNAYWLVAYQRPAA